MLCVVPDPILFIPTSILTLQFLHQLVPSITLCTQWAAVSTCLSDIKEPPQKWYTLFLNETMYGNSFSSASEPPLDISKFSVEAEIYLLIYFMITWYDSSYFQLTMLYSHEIMRWRINIPNNNFCIVSEQYFLLNIEYRWEVVDWRRVGYVTFLLTGKTIKYVNCIIYKINYYLLVILDTLHIFSFFCYSLEKH